MPSTPEVTRMKADARYAKAVLDAVTEARVERQRDLHTKHPQDPDPDIAKAVDSLELLLVGINARLLRQKAIGR